MSDKEQFNDKRLVKDPRKRVTLWQRQEENQEKKQRRFVYEPTQQNTKKKQPVSKETSKKTSEKTSEESASGKSTARKEATPKKETKSSNLDETLLEKDNVSARIRKNIFKNRMLIGGKRPAGMTDEEYRLQKRKHLLKITAIVVAVVAVVVFAFLNNEFKQYKNYSVRWQDTDSIGDDVCYVAFQKYFMKCSKDGVSCLDQSGQVLWNQTYSMASPKPVSAGSYLAVYDLQGTALYIFDENGCVGQATTNRPMNCAVISEQGIVATVQEDTSTGSHYINYYNNDGSSLDVEIKTLLAGNGYPLDIAISPDGQELVASYLYMDNGTMQNQVVFYNFDVGKNESERTVGGFRDYESTMVANVAFLGDQSAVAFADDRIDFYSLKNALEPSRKESYTFDRKIKSVFYNDSYAGVVLSTETNETDQTSETQENSEESQEENTEYELIVYNSSGGKVFTKKLDFDYSHIALSGDGLIIYNTNKCMVYNMNGRLKYNGTLTGSMEQVVRLSERTYLVSGNGIVQGITLQ
jgi:hypothetical protein